MNNFIFDFEDSSNGGICTQPPGPAVCDGRRIPWGGRHWAAEAAIL